jgi:hypothetical protein
VEDLVVDFHPLNGSPDGEQTELIAAAIEKNRLAPYIEALGSIEVNPEKLTLNGLPTALCLAHQADLEEDHCLLPALLKQKCFVRKSSKRWRPFRNPRI